MPGINEDRERQVVPLWRTFESTNRRGELASVSPASGDRFSDEMLSELAEDWKTQPSLSIASDFVSVALILGRFSVATDAADFILAEEAAPSAAKSVAASYLREGKPPSLGSTSTAAFPQEAADSGIATGSIALQLHSEIHEVRKQLIRYPRNPILWSNLARLYTSLGVQDKATRAMQASLSIAPENRFLLRAASRLFLHQGLRDRAHRLLANADSVRSDPWLLAAEIATAASMGRTSRHIKTGRKVLDANKQSPFHLSELASALGTLESLAGNIKAARPLITFSLQQPAENSIAQAAWLHRNVGGIGLETEKTSSFEANAWFAWGQAKWGTALIEARRWQADQPFSSRPAILGSHLASVLTEDYEEAVAFARQGLLSNPDDFALQNNLAFSLALMGDADGAARVLRRIDEGQLNDQQRVVLMATRGFIAFRSGDAIAGRASYQSAIFLGKRLRDVRGNIAKIYYALEELRIAAADAEEIRKEALDGAAMLTEPSQLAMVEKLRKYRVR